jgi:23S rRNA pseudouridine1911/1915/1917 synthase
MPSEAGDLRRFSVPATLQGARLDRALCVLIPDTTRGYAKELIVGGHVRVDGAVVTKPGTLVAQRGSLEISLAPRRPGRIDAADLALLRVLHEDDDLIVIDKPQGVLAHPTVSASGATVSELAVLRYGPLPTLQGDDRPGIVHRLDAGTSGVMVLARTEHAFAELMRQFRAREVTKTYLALVYGEPRFDTGWVEAPIARGKDDPSRMSIAPSGEGRAAATYYEVRERFRGLSLIAAQPKTGRTHQIRVHLTSVGMPLVGDRLYKRRGGPSLILPPDAPVPARQCLHAWRLRFKHPTNGEMVEFEAPPPADFERMLAWVRANRSVSR